MLFIKHFLYFKYAVIKKESLLLQNKYDFTIKITPYYKPRKL